MLAAASWKMKNGKMWMRFEEDRLANAKRDHLAVITIWLVPTTLLCSQVEKQHDVEVERLRHEQLLLAVFPWDITSDGSFSSTVAQLFLSPNIAVVS